MLTSRKELMNEDRKGYISLTNGEKICCLLNEDDMKSLLNKRLNYISMFQITDTCTYQTYIPRDKVVKIDLMKGRIRT